MLIPQVLLSVESIRSNLGLRSARLGLNERRECTPTSKVVHYRALLMKWEAMLYKRVN
jgi:hypothetical protein